MRATLADKVACLRSELGLTVGLTMIQAVGEAQSHLVMPAEPYASLPQQVDQLLTAAGKTVEEAVGMAASQPVSCGVTSPPEAAVTAPSAGMPPVSQHATGTMLLPSQPPIVPLRALPPHAATRQPVQSASDDHFAAATTSHKANEASLPETTYAAVGEAKAAKKDEARYVALVEKGIEALDPAELQELPALKARVVKRREDASVASLAMAACHTLQQQEEVEGTDTASLTELLKQLDFLRSVISRNQATNCIDIELPPTVQMVSPPEAWGRCTAAIAASEDGYLSRHVKG